MREWLDHPVGEPLPRAVLGSVDEDALTPAFGVPLAQMAQFAQEVLTDDGVSDLSTQVEIAHDLAAAAS